MKILKQGKIHTWSAEKECKGYGRPGCGALLQLEEGDIIKVGVGSGMDDHYDTVYDMFVCPLCEQKTVINSVPYWVQRSTFIEVQKRNAAIRAARGDGERGQVNG